MNLIERVLVRLGLRKLEPERPPWKVDREGNVVVPTRRVVLRGKREEK